jgi:hypothetical protein
MRELTRQLVQVLLLRNRTITKCPALWECTVIVNLRAYTTAGTGTESVAEALLQSVLPGGSVTVNERAYTTAGTGTKPVAELV